MRAKHFGIEILLALIRIVFLRYFIFFHFSIFNSIPTVVIHPSSLNICLCVFVLGEGLTFKLFLLLPFFAILISWIWKISIFSRKKTNCMELKILDFFLHTRFLSSHFDYFPAFDFSHTHSFQFIRFELLTFSFGAFWFRIICQYCNAMLNDDNKWGLIFS